MEASTNGSWFALLGIGLAGLLVGWVASHLWSRHAKRAVATRLAALCDQLDIKDRTLQGLRADLQMEQMKVLELQRALEARQTVAALRLEENEDPAFFRRLVRAL